MKKTLRNGFYKVYRRITILEKNKHDESQIFKIKSNRKRLFEYLKKHPTMSTEGLYFQFPDMKPSTIRVYKHDFKKFNRDIVIKAALCIFFDVYEHKLTLHQQLSKIEQETIDRLERWCGYQEHKKEKLMKEYERRFG